MLQHRGCFSSPDITWKRFVITHSSSSPFKFCLIFIPETNCNFSWSVTSVFTAARVNGRFEVSQHAIAFSAFSPKNKFPFKSRAEAADCDPLGPSIVNAPGNEFGSFSHAVLLFKTLKATAFSCSEARAWKYNKRFGPLFLSMAIPKIPSIKSNDSPEIVWVPNDGYGYISSILPHTRIKKANLYAFSIEFLVDSHEAIQCHTNKFTRSFRWIHQSFSYCSEHATSYR